MEVNLLEDECIDDLQLQGLKLIQKKTGFKFGIDAVLLADFAKEFRSDRTMDLCTGTGVIPVLLSAKTNTPKLSALEIQPDIADMARRSVCYNHLEDRIEIVCADLRRAAELYPKGSFSAVTCNPPYMKSGTAVLNEADSKTISRHEIYCTVEDVIRVSSQLLRQKGHFFMIHRPSRLVDILCTMRSFKLEPKRIRFVHASAGKAPNLVLIDGIAGGGTELKLLDPLYVYNQDGSYSDEINRIYNRSRP